GRRARAAGRAPRRRGARRRPLRAGDRARRTGRRPGLGDAPPLPARRGARRRGPGRRPGDPHTGRRRGAGARGQPAGGASRGTMSGLDLSAARAAALAAAQRWGIRVGEPFALANVSVVVAAGDGVLKAPWEGDDESLHEAEALSLWDGDGAVRL